MGLLRIVSKMHKWLATVAGLFTLIWFVSAFAILIPWELVTRVSKLVKSEGPTLSPPAPPLPDFKAVSVSVPQAIVNVETATSGKALATAASLELLENKLSYRISTRDNGVWWVNASDGSVSQLDAQAARRLAIASGADDKTLDPAELITSHGVKYSLGPLPVYRIASSESSAEFIVDPSTGQVQQLPRTERWYRFVEGMHTLNFLNPILGYTAVRLLMWLLAIVGTGMTVFGIGILWLQLQYWRQARSRS